VDAHSKWLEVKRLNNTDTRSILQALREVFATLGIPEYIISDNGPQFTSQEFSEFCRKNIIKHRRVATYHPASNGLAEVGVRIFKQNMKKYHHSTWEVELPRFLLQYRITPHSTTGVTPAYLMFGREIYTPIKRMIPNVRNNVEKTQERTKFYRDSRSKHAEFEKGETVLWKDRLGTSIKATVLRKTAPNSYDIRLQTGKKILSHVENLNKGIATNQQEEEPEDTNMYFPQDETREENEQEQVQQVPQQTVQQQDIRRSARIQEKNASRNRK
jgi:hypothetical protein